MGKSPIPKTDYVMYFICWVMGTSGYFTRGFYQSTLVWFLLNHILRGAGRTISKRTLHSLDREDRQDFVIRCLQFNEYSQYYALKRTRTSTLFSTRFWVSRVYHFTTKASWKWIVFHEYDIYLVWCMEYMTKVGCWSIAIDRSCHIGPSRTSNCLDLNYPEDALYILILYQIKKMDNQTYFSIQ